MVSPHCLLPRSNTYLSVFLFFSFHGSIAFLFSFFIFSTIKSCRVNALRLVHPSPTEGRLGGFRVLAVMQKAAVNIHARVFCVGRQVLVSLVKYPGAQFLDRAGKARLALQAAASLSCKAAVWFGVPRSSEGERLLLHEHRRSAASLSWVLAFATGAQPYLIVIICTSLMTHDAEHLVTCLLAMVRYRFRSFACF